MGFASKGFQLRPARSDDFRFAWSLYEELMKQLTIELLGRWNEPGQKQVVELAVTHPGTSIVVKDELDAGWLHVVESPNAIYLGQLYLAPSFQNRGIGTAILRELTDRARRGSKTLTLDVMKNNRSRMLYERLGFHVIGQSEYKLKMQWQETSPSDAMFEHGDSSFISIQSQRLVLRRFTERDLPTFVGYRSCPEVALYQSWGNYTINDARTFLKEMNEIHPAMPGKWFQFAVERKEKGQHIGDCALMIEAGDPEQARIGYTVAPQYQSQGFATEAVGRLLGYVFGTLGKHRVIATLDVLNRSSVRVVEKLGMRREGHFIESAFFKGRWCDEYMHAILRREWKMGRI